MLRYTIMRLLWIIPVIICVAFIIYALMDLAPGTIIDTLSTENLTEEQYQELLAKYDLDKPMVYRYGKYMWNLLHGDLGKTQATNLDIWKEYRSRFPATLKLAIAGMCFGIVVSIPLGIFAARHAGTIADNLVTVFSMIGVSMPSFWLGLMLLYVFAYKLKLFPLGGFNGGIRSIILPGICSGLMMAGMTARQTRSSMLEVLRADYLRTARAKGVPEKKVIRKHALGNALIPIITSIGNTLAMMLAGSAVVESVFSWPGVGTLTVQAVNNRDATQACGCVILTCIIFVVLLLLVDLAYAMVDPRIKAQYASKKVKRSAAK